MRIPVLLIGLALAQASVFAQEQPEHVLPPDPPIAHLPPAIQWTRSMVSDSGKKKRAGAGALVSMETTKSGDVRRVVSLFGNNDKTEVWFTDNTFLIRRVAGGEPHVKVFAVDPENSSTPLPADLSELAWISSGAFVKNEEFEGQEAWLFEGNAVPSPSLEGNDDAPLPETAQVRAWVDPKTRLPLGFFDGTNRWRYKFTAFNGELTLPPALATEWEKFRERAKANTEIRSRVP